MIKSIQQLAKRKLYRFYNYLSTQGLTDKELHCIESAKTLHDSKVA